MATMKPEYWLVIFLFLAWTSLGVLSFFRGPTYASGVETTMEVLKYALVSLMSFLFGRTLPEQVGDPKPGQTTTKQTQTSSSVTSDPPTDPPAPTISKPA